MNDKIPAYVTPEYLQDLQGKLVTGKGSGKPGERCSIQEVRAWLNLDPSGDACPDCVCPVLHKLVIVAQDRRESWRREIALLLPLLVGSRVNREATARRAYYCADWAIRTVAPFALEAASRALAEAGIPDHPEKLKAHADKLSALPPVNAAAAAAADAARAAAAAADAADAADAAADADAAAARAARAAAPSPVILIRQLLEIKEEPCPEQSES